MLRSLLPAVAFAASVAVSTAVAAQPIPEGGLTAQEVAVWLRGEGLDAQVREDADGPQVASGANGVGWDMIGFDCQAGRCASWQFSAAFLVDSDPAAAVAQWNVQRRYLKAFVLTEGGRTAAVAQYDVLLASGSTYEGLVEHMRLFASTAPLFAQDIGVLSPAAD